MIIPVRLLRQPRQFCRLLYSQRSSKIINAALLLIHPVGAVHIIEHIMFHLFYIINLLALVTLPMVFYVILPLALAVPPVESHTLGIGNM